MDFEQLYKTLPKEPIKWDFLDVEVFLKFIKLETFVDKFKEHSIDGSVIMALDRNDLEKTLKIENPIVIKKLLLWFQHLDSYESFVHEKAKSTFLDDFLDHPKQSPLRVSEKPQFTFPKKANLPPRPGDFDLLGPKIEDPSEVPEDLSETVIKPKEERKKSETVCYQYPKGETLVKPSPETTPENGEIELVLQPVEGSQTNFYRFDSKGGKIGRHSTNEMVILEESISRHHAEILFSDSSFYLKDTGSTTGTFIKVPEVVLREKMIIEMGSNQFLIERVSEKENLIEIVVLEGTEKNLKKTLNFNSTPVVTFGRKVNNTIAMATDNHMSNTHSRIQKDMRNLFILEDLNSTNGTWMRLSPEQQKSPPHPLRINMVFKIGLSQSFLVKKITTQSSNAVEIEKPRKAEEKDCVICCENEKNAIFFPCKHNCACMKCATKLKFCPICREKIEKFLQFFKT